MVNLIVTGKATSNTFDNIMEIDTGGAKKVTSVTSLIRFGNESCSTVISIEEKSLIGSVFIHTKMWNIQPEHRRLDRQRPLDGRRGSKKDSNDQFFFWGGGGRNRVEGAGGCVA